MRSLANQADDSEPNRKECSWAFIFLSPLQPFPLYHWIDHQSIDDMAFA
ncbi:MAG: hypothetical protein ABW157_12290 [Candidatus Thiodiazotropha sp. LLP2]